MTAPESHSSVRPYAARATTEIALRLRREIGDDPYFWVGAVGTFLGVVLVAFPLLSFLGFFTAAVSLPLLVYQSCQRYLNRALADFESLPDRLQSDSRRTMGAIEQRVSEGLLKYSTAFALADSPQFQTDDAELRYLLARICLPVDEATIARQHGSPLVTDLQVEIALQRVEHYPWGDVAVFHHRERFTRHVPPPIDPWRVFPPTLVVDGGAFEVDSMVRLASKGLVEPLWPIPARWLDALSNDEHEELLSIPWLTVGRFMAAGLPSPGHQVRRTRTADDLRKLLSPSHNLTPEDLTAVRKHVVAAWRPAYSGDGQDWARIERWLQKDANIEVEVESEYRVWVRSVALDESLMRYSIQFWRPATVTRMLFEVAESERARVRLTSAAVNCPFELTSEQERHQVERQDLTWRGPGPDGEVPFLPGHGVTFHWEALEDRDLSQGEN